MKNTTEQTQVNQPQAQPAKAVPETNIHKGRKAAAAIADDADKKQKEAQAAVVYTADTFVLENGFYPNGSVLPFIDSKENFFKTAYNNFVDASKKDKLPAQNFLFYGSEAINKIIALSDGIRKMGKPFFGFYDRNMVRKAIICFVSDYITTHLSKDAQDLLTTMRSRPYTHFLNNFHDVNKPDKTRDFFNRNHMLLSALVVAFNNGKIPSEIVTFLTSKIDVQRSFSFTPYFEEVILEEQDAILEVELIESLTKFKLGIKGLTSIRNYITDITIDTAYAKGTCAKLFGYDSTNTNSNQLERVMGVLIAEMGLAGGALTQLENKNAIQNLCYLLSHEALTLHYERNQYLSLLESVYKRVEDKNNTGHYPAPIYPRDIPEYTPVYSKAVEIENNAYGYPWQPTKPEAIPEVEK